jgi:hypothetical protein
MVKCGVFFVVRTEFLNIIQTSFSFKGLMVIIGRELEATIAVVQIIVFSFFPSLQNLFIVEVILIETPYKGDIFIV